MGYGYGGNCCDCCDWFDTFNADSSSTYTSNAETGSVTWNIDTANGLLEQTNSGKGTYYRLGEVDLNPSDAQIRLSAKINEGTANSKVGIFIGGWLRFYAQFDLGDYEADEVTAVGEEDSNQPNVTGGPTPADGDVIAIELFYDDIEGDSGIIYQFVVNGNVVHRADTLFTPTTGEYKDLNMGVFSDGGGEWEWIRLECNAPPTPDTVTPCDETLCIGSGAATITECSHCTNAPRGWLFRIDGFVACDESQPIGDRWYFLEHDFGCEWKSGSYQIGGDADAYWHMRVEASQVTLQLVTSENITLVYLRSSALECLCRNGFDLDEESGCNDAPSTICIIPIVDPLNPCGECDIVPYSYTMQINGPIHASPAAEAQAALGGLDCPGGNSGGNSEPCGGSCSNFLQEIPLKTVVSPVYGAYEWNVPVGTFYPSTNDVTECGRCTSSVWLVCNQNFQNGLWSVLFYRWAEQNGSTQWCNSIRVQTPFTKTEAEIVDEGCLADHLFVYTGPSPPNDDQSDNALCNGLIDPGIGRFFPARSGKCVGFDQATVEIRAQI